jgi:hypothetical protein
MLLAEPETGMIGVPVVVVSVFEKLEKLSFFAQAKHIEQIKNIAVDANVANAYFCSVTI